MAADFGDLIQVTDKQLYLNQELLNVYYYRVVSLTGLIDGYLDLMADWFESDLLPPILDIQNDYLTHVSVDIRNLSNNVDVLERPLGILGTNVATSDTVLPSWVTVNFKLVRESLATRNGSKRYSGLLEGQNSFNAYAIPAPELAALETALAADVYFTAALVMEPVIVRRPIVPPVGTSYTYSSIGAAIYTRYGTQNTRKP